LSTRFTIFDFDKVDSASGGLVKFWDGQNPVFSRFPMSVKANLIVGMNMTMFNCFSIGLKPVPVLQWFPFLPPHIFPAPIHFFDINQQDSYLDLASFIPQTFSNE